jgi:biotin carboxylase
MQGPAIRIAKDMGLETVVLDADKDAPCTPLADRFENIDLKDKHRVLSVAETLSALAGIMTAGTDFSTTVAFVAEKLGLPGVSYETALNASDKGRMRECFRRAGVPSPRFTVLETMPNADFNLPFPFPVVVKPVDNMGARGCRKVDNPTELRSAAVDALRFSGSGRIIVEEFIGGPEFSIDAIVYQGEITITGFADRHIFFPPYFIEMGHTMPTNIDEKDRAEVVDIFKQGVRALGIRDGAAKGDVKLARKGRAMVGEIAARLSGGYMSGWTYPYSSGVEPIRAAIQVAIGEKPLHLTPVRQWTSAERAFISIPGKVFSIVKKELPPQVKDVFFRVKEGDRVKFPENNVSKAGNVIALAPNREEAVNAAETAARNMLIRLSAPDVETEAFLSTGEQNRNFADEFSNTPSTPQFPPDAFTVPPRIPRSLEKMPESLEYFRESRTLSSANVEPFFVGIMPFPEFTESGLMDYAGRTVAESLDAVRLLTGQALSITDDASTADIVLGRAFWQAFIRGGYQGAAYVVDKLGIPIRNHSIGKS